MRIRLLKAKEAAAMLNMPLRSFYQNCVAMGLPPIELGGQAIASETADPRTTKKSLRWPEQEITRFIELKLQRRFQNSAKLNSVLRAAAVKRKA